MGILGRMQPTYQASWAEAAAADTAPAPPPATVVIATRNRGAELCRTLERLSRLPERPPVVVVDNGSQDGTAPMVRHRFPGIELIALRRNRGAWARNLGVLRAHTPLIALADDDSWWAPGALTAAAAVLAACPRVGLLAARILVGPDHVPDEVNAVMAASPLPSDGLPGPRVVGFLGCGTVVRREAYLEVGGFSRLLFIGGEEQLFAYDLAAAGWAACYRPDIVAYHYPSPSRQPATRRYQEARNRALVAWLRRPLRCALTETGRLTRQAVHDPIAGRALGGLAVRLPRALLGRRPLPADVETAIRDLGANHAG
jgi:GT2 family glycosyltransferase